MLERGLQYWRELWWTINTDRKELAVHSQLELSVFFFPRFRRRNQMLTSSMMGHEIQASHGQSKRGPPSSKKCS